MSLLISSLYVWTVSLTDANRATHSPMGSLCPVLTLSPEPSAVAKEKGLLECFRFGQSALLLSVGDGKKDLRGFSLSSPAHSFFVHLCFDFSFMSCCICIGTKKREEREYQQGEQFSQGGMTA